MKKNLSKMFPNAFSMSISKKRSRKYSSKVSLSAALFVLLITLMLLAGCNSGSGDFSQIPGSDPPAQAGTALPATSENPDTGAGTAGQAPGQTGNASSGAASDSVSDATSDSASGTDSDAASGTASDTNAAPDGSETGHENPDASAGASQEPPSPQAPDGTTAGTAEPPVSPSPDSGPVILTIRGDGVSGETTWTLEQLRALSGGYRENTYSTTNNWPNFGHMRANGVSLQFLLREAGMLSGAASFKLIATDGYYVIVTYDQMFGARYSYAAHSSAGSSGASIVEPVVAWEWGEGSVRQERIRPFFGQRGPFEVNTLTFVKDLQIIEVTGAPQGAWDAPGASVENDAAVPSGTELELSHGSMDNIRIYYTLDGSEPDYGSLVYNQSTSYYQPHLIKPIVLTESVTIKAFAAGYGRDPSPVVTISITVG